MDEIKLILFQNASKNIFQHLGQMFYIMNPHESSFSKVDQVPDFIIKAWPYFLLFIILENLILWINRKPIYRFNDGLTSISVAIIGQTGRLLFRGAESYTYVYLYENFHIADLPWNFPLTWYLAAVGVDFCYYWMHRASHEVHILWAQHQVHHSSEEFNMIVGLRHSIVQEWCGFIFYLPLAIIIPPAHFITHQQFNLLFQFWVHTKAIKTVGPLEYIFNTPNHHRVHHGSNFHYLDKNYGGVLIIWDRIFGTFAKEIPGEEIVYGLVVNSPSFNPLHLETFYSVNAIEKMISMSTWKDKFRALLYGPSWQPGKPRLGAEEDIVKVGPREKYDVQLPLWCNFYLLIHFCLVIYIFQVFVILHSDMNPLTTIGFTCYIIGSLTSIGLLFDNARYGAVCELTRCALIVLALEQLDFPGINKVILISLEIFFVLSGLFWILKSIKVFQISKKEKNT